MGFYVYGGWSWRWVDELTVRDLMDGYAGEDRLRLWLLLMAAMVLSKSSTEFMMLLMSINIEFSPILPYILANKSRMTC